MCDLINKNLKYLWLQDVPVLVGALGILKGFEITSGFWMSLFYLLLCLKNHVSYTLFSYQCFDSFAQKSPEGIKEVISGTLVQ